MVIDFYSIEPRKFIVKQQKTRLNLPGSLKCIQSIVHNNCLIRSEFIDGLLEKLSNIFIILNEENRGTLQSLGGRWNDLLSHSHSFLMKKDQFSKHKEFQEV